MRITDIYIKNYRAFYGEHHISLYKDGKNLKVYIENGSHEEPETEEKTKKKKFVPIEINHSTRFKPCAMNINE